MTKEKVLQDFKERFISLYEKKLRLFYPGWSDIVINELVDSLKVGVEKSNGFSLYQSKELYLIDLDYVMVFLLTIEVYHDEPTSSDKLADYMKQVYRLLKDMIIFIQGVE